MLTTSLAIGTGALRLIQQLSAVATPAPEDALLAHDCLNELVDDLRTQQAVAPSTQRAVYPLTINVQTYTIGTGGAFNQAWPELIYGGSVIPNRNATAALIQEIPIGRPLTWAEFQAVTQKGSQSAYPTSFFFDGAWALGLGTIWVFPVPTISIASLVLYTPNVLGTFATQTTQYDLKPGYVRMLRYNLAEALCTEYEKPVPPKVEKIALRTLANIKRANQQFNLGRVDPAMPGTGRGGQFNPWTGTYNA